MKTVLCTIRSLGALFQRRLLGLVLLIVFASAGTHASAGTSPNDWARAPDILGRIVPPTFPAQDFVITNYGAMGDGTTDCTFAFSNAIAACYNAGGGRVVVPAGNFLTGAIRLLDNVNLHVAAGATILFSTDTNGYLPLALVRWQGIEIMNYSPFIYAVGQTNIAITGTGVLNGQASSSAWWDWFSLSGPDETTMWNMASTNLPVAQRIFGPGHYLRPYFIQPMHCKNVLIEDVTIRNSPMWVISPVYCTNVTVQGVTSVSTGHNTDGCDPDSCEDVLIKDCSFSEGDDCIAIKSGRDQDGLRVNIPCRNIIIQNCRFATGHGGITCGSEESGGITNVFAENCVFSSSSLNQVMRFKNNTARGGYIRNIYVRNCICQNGSSGTTAIHATMQYTSQSPANTGTNTPLLGDIDIRDCAFANAGQALYMKGVNSTNPVTGITIANCRFTGTSTANYFSATNNITLLNNKGGGF